MNSYDIKRLEMYSNNLVDYHLITDLMPSLARMYFLNQMDDVHLSAVQSVSEPIIYSLLQLPLICALVLRVLIFLYFSI